MIGGELKRRRLPPIQLLVVSKEKHRPGDTGLLNYLGDDRRQLERLSPTRLFQLWESKKADIFGHNWRKVLRGFGLLPLPMEAAPLPPYDEGDEEAAQEKFGLEGRIRLQLHRLRERDTGLARDKKAQAARLGKLGCEVCNFVFAERYGDHGAGFIECHHRVPLSKLKAGGEESDAQGPRTRLCELS